MSATRAFIFSFFFFKLFYRCTSPRSLSSFFANNGREEGGGKNKKKGKKDSRTYEKYIKDRYANFNLYKLGLDTIDRN